MPWREQAYVALVSGPLEAFRHYGPAAQTIIVAVVSLLLAGGASFLWLDERYARAPVVDDIRRQVSPEALDRRYASRDEHQALADRVVHELSGVRDEVAGVRTELLRSERRRLRREIHAIESIIADGEARAGDRERLIELQDDLRFVDRALGLRPPL